ncbi:MAG: MurR/RpiR family transcriptional regulator [Ignavibacteria bacterium]|jgi:DNA-binding MurR/RpiR family transcriptional regulator|nr:MurR/RpiR family transcriptional regulator [Ignavibacteria bacterium]MDH7528095.1 MurR/RpiR family transcriptional regulator [Ignavibacteria bacterium]
MKNIILAKYNSIPKKQRKLADYFLENLDVIPFLNIYEISEATQFSVASIVRFTQRLGFKGYSEFRSELLKGLQKNLKKLEMFPSIKVNELKEHTLIAVANQEIKNINETLQLIDKNTFDAVIDLILKSERVFTMGLGISYLLSQILSYQLSQVGIDSSFLRNDTSTFYDQILFMTNKDLLIAFSFPPYSVETIEAAKFAKERKIKIVAITNKSSAPLTFHSTQSLIVKSENMLFTNSFSAISVLINAIATECAKRDKKRAEKILNEFNLIMKRFNQVIT